MTPPRRDLLHAEAALLALAANILRWPSRLVPDYAGLSVGDQKKLADHLARLASGDTPASDDERRAAVALAHRVVDDDHPELSPLWRRPPVRTAPAGGWHVPDPRTLPDDGLGQGSAVHR